MWYVIRTLFLLWLFVLSTIFTFTEQLPQNLGIILMSGMFLAFAVSFLETMTKDKL